jgi:uncharacterized membrane protein YhfC
VNDALLTITHPLNSLLMMALPVALGLYLTRRFELPWRLFWIGAGTFLFSQVLHIPTNQMIAEALEGGALAGVAEPWRRMLTSVVWGLSAGLFEEGARYVAYRWPAREARSWPQALLLGAGHGGLEAVALGVLTLVNAVVLFGLRGADLATIVPAEQLAAAQQQVQAYWSVPWPVSLLGALERLLALPVQLSLSVLVWRAVARRSWGWLGLALGWHTVVDAVALLAAGAWMGREPWGLFAIEGVVAMASAISLLIVLRLRGSTASGAPAPQSASRQLPGTPARGRPASRQDLEATRYDD